MKASMLLFVAPVALAAAVQPVHAQVTLDLAKVSCDQWVAYKITDPQKIALWLSGYYNGKRGNTLIDTQRLAAEGAKLRDFCLTNPNLPLMQAVERLKGEE